MKHILALALGCGVAVGASMAALAQDKERQHSGHAAQPPEYLRALFVDHQSAP